MQKTKLDGHADPESSAAHLAAEAPKPNGEALNEVHDEGNGEARFNRNDIVATVATVGVVGVGAAVFEAALLPGIVLGVAAMWVPQYLPKMGATLNPLFRSTIRGCYKLGHKTREMMAEAQEQVHDIVAEVHAEGDLDTSASRGPMAAAAGTTN
jgi:hypothetical protein